MPSSREVAIEPESSWGPGRTRSEPVTARPGSAAGRPQLDRRCPAQLALGAAHVEAAAADFAGPLGSELGLRERPAVRDVVQRLEQVEHGRLLAAPDVERPGHVALGGHQVRPHHVADLDPVARLPSVSEHGRPAAVDQRAAEDRDHAGLPVHVLTRPVDVAVAERDGRRARAGACTARSSPRPRTCSGRRAPAAGSGGPPAVGRHPRSPYSPPPVEVLTTRRAPTARAASSTPIVPSTFDGGVVRRAARPSGGRRSARRGGTRPRAAPRRRSPPPRRHRARRRPPAWRRSATARSRFDRFPVERLSITVTWSPRATSASTRFEPMKPAPPVTTQSIRPAA